MKVGTDTTETGPAAVMAEDKGQKVEAEDTTMTREDTMLVGTAAEITETIVGTNMKGEIAEIERILTGIGEIIAQTGETEVGGDRTEARVGEEMIEARVGGKVAMTRKIKCYRCGNLGHIATYCKNF